MTTSGSQPRSLLAHSQMPMPSVQCLIACVHRQPLRRRLLAGDDHIDVIAAAQAMVGHGQQRVGVRRKINANHLRLFIDHVVDKAGVLMAEAVVILPPDVRAEQIVERGDRPPPGNVVARLSATWHAG